MMETPQNPELVNKLDSAFGSEEKNSGQTIRVSDQEKSSDGFVTIDLERFSRGINKDVSSNSRIKLQRSLSRKGYQRSNEKISSSDPNGNTRENSSPNSPSKGSSMLEKTAMVGGSVDGVDPTVSNNPQQVHHHQITITTSNIITAPTERRLTSRKNSFRRSSHFWPLDPKKVMIFFATLSSIGTIMLIMLTLFMNQQPEPEILP